VPSFLYDTSASIGDVVFNADDAGGVGWYLVNLDGWTGSPQGTLAPVQKPRQAGAWSGKSYSKPRTLVLTGAMVAPSKAEARDAMDQLNEAIPLDDQILYVTEAGLQRYITVRRDGDIIPKWESDCACTFTVQMVALDGRRLAEPLSGATMLPQSSGGLVIPYTIPYAIASTVASGAVTLTNPGNDTGPVQLRIDGPCVSPQVAHQGTGATLTFGTSLTLAAGEYLLVDMDKKVALANGQVNRSQYITSRQWSGFDPGPNSWSFSAATFNPSSQLTVTATPAWR
jgi:hypothetical protein